MFGLKWFNLTNSGEYVSFVRIFFTYNTLPTKRRINRDNDKDKENGLRMKTKLLKKPKDAATLKVKHSANSYLFTRSFTLHLNKAFKKARSKNLFLNTEKQLNEFEI